MVHPVKVYIDMYWELLTLKKKKEKHLFSFYLRERESKLFHLIIHSLMPATAKARLG